LKENTRTLTRKFENNEKLTWFTCYDYSFARTINSTGIDMILVTDSGDMVALGYTDTVPIAMEEITILASVAIIF
jgi:3-methyl-2-oxobutanoate hydroxymethyltransferase